jgi:O-methyltransferase domain
MLTDFPWRRFNRFIDVGGSSGSFLAALLERHPNSSGVIFDLPQVAAFPTEAKRKLFLTFGWVSTDESPKDGIA